jgi:hypothetical protein
MHVLGRHPWLYSLVQSIRAPKCKTVSMLRCKGKRRSIPILVQRPPPNNLTYPKSIALASKTPNAVHQTTTDKLTTNKRQSRKYQPKAQ